MGNGGCGRAGSVVRLSVAIWGGFRELWQGRWRKYSFESMGIQKFYKKVCSFACLGRNLGRNEKGGFLGVDSN